LSLHNRLSLTEVGALRECKKQANIALSYTYAPPSFAVHLIFFPVSL
jgi:hypothetical protein